MLRYWNRSVVSERLRCFMEDQGLGYEELAILIGVRARTVERWIQSGTGCDLKSLVGLVIASGISADYFLGLIDSPLPLAREGSQEEERAA